MDIEQRLREMTPEEKLAQMTQFASNYLFSAAEGDLTGAAGQFDLSGETWAAVGTVLGTRDAATVLSLQEKHLSQSRLKDPLIFMRDVIHGYATIYPIPLGMGATWSPELLRRCCRMAAKEAVVSGINVTFAPMVDLARDARWGRVMESTGEDPYLNCLMAEAAVKGYQGDGTGPYDIAACVKHFAAYGAAESGRDYNAVEVTEHTLREYYLPAYKAAVDAGVKMLMTSFNTIGGVPTGADEHLYNDILRGEWGFKGLVISDWNAVGEMLKHGYCADETEAAEQAMHTGTDIEMMSVCYLKGLKKCLEAGTVTEEAIDASVRKILELKDALGLFEKPYRGASVEEEKKLWLCKEHRALAKEAAVKAAVLLKNDGLLPLSESLPSLAVIGPFAEEGMIGAWACSGKAAEAVSVAEGIKAVFAGRVETARGCDGALDAQEDEELLRAAEDAARACEAVVLCLGEEGKNSGEAKSRTDLRLPAAQQSLLRRVLAANPRTAVVLFTGRPLVLTEELPALPALMTMWQPGTEGGSAAADLLFGRENFSGRLTMTFPRAVGQCPIYYNALATGKPGGEYTGGYMSMYIDAPATPLFPFGYGLSYTAFEISDPMLDRAGFASGETLTASVTVKNTGARTGTQTVQLYLRDLVARPARPTRELKGFRQVTLAPGEEKTLSFTVDESMLAYFTRSGEYKAEKGAFELWLCEAADKGTPVRFEFMG